MDNCKECAARNDGYHGTFNITCANCRTALAMNESCKIVRAYIVESMEKWGPTEGWKVEPHCGCGKTCKRKANLKQV